MASQSIIPPPDGKHSPVGHWPSVSDEQRQRDRQIRQEQAEARRSADTSFRQLGRWWTDEGRLQRRETQMERERGQQ